MDRLVWLLDGHGGLGLLDAGLSGEAGLTLGSSDVTPVVIVLTTTMGTLGAAVLAVPLARLAQSKGRRVSLSTGAWIAVAGGLLVIAAAFPANVPLLLAGLLLMGSASALNLQARFAATDLAIEDTRGRDLSMVVWSTTIGAVIGPNLFDPGESEYLRFWGPSVVCLGAGGLPTE